MNRSTRCATVQPKTSASYEIMHVLKRKAPYIFLVRIKYSLAIFLTAIFLISCYKNSLRMMCTHQLDAITATNNNSPSHDRKHVVRILNREFWQSYNMRVYSCENQIQQVGWTDSIGNRWSNRFGQAIILEMQSIWINPIWSIWI